MDVVETENKHFERRRTSQRRMLEAAAEIIGESGPASLTLAEVGTRAGYSRGLATHHFGSKGAMVETIMRVVADQYLAEVPNPVDDEGDGSPLVPIVDWYFDILADFKPVNRARVILWADAAANRVSDMRGAAQQMDESFREKVSTTLERLRSAGRLPADVDPAGASVVIVGMLRGVALQYLLDDSLEIGVARAQAHRMCAGLLAD